MPEIRTIRFRGVLSRVIGFMNLNDALPGSILLPVPNDHFDSEDSEGSIQDAR